MITDIITPLTVMINDEKRQLQVIKCITQVNDDEDLNRFYLLLDIDGEKYQTKEDSTMELLLLELQKLLPSSHKILCCQSCMHGSFCPYGDNENEIYCFKKQTNPILFKWDVIEIFNLYSQSKISLPRHNLCYICNDYKKIIPEQYSYRSWLDSPPI